MAEYIAKQAKSNAKTNNQNGQSKAQQAFDGGGIPTRPPKMPPPSL
jgi:hypothetical protein